MNKKQYGLFVPKKNASGGSTQFLKKPSIFDEDSNSDEESNVDWVKKSLQKEPYGGRSLTRQAKSDIQKVLAEDPTAYQYDEVYDELQKNINDNLAAKKSDRKPKYIQSLMKTAEIRKRENERRLARQIQKEREAEGDEFADKEVFVTAAYKKKLEEMKKMDEEDKHTAMLEDIGDVTKQRDMVGFYRHLYRATVTKEDLQEPPSPVRSKPEDKPTEEPESSMSSKPRQYRKRKSSESSDGEPEKSLEGKAAKADNPDADSDLPSSSDEDEKNEPAPSKDPAQDVSQNKTDQPQPQDNEKENDKETTEGDKVPEENDENKEPVKEPPKPKVSIWVKRTVGENFDAALQRYYERKAERLAARGS